MRTEDGYIVHKCLNGEKEAFGLLVDKYKEGVYALAYSKLSDFQDAQDVVQEVFIKAYRKLNTLRRWDSFMAWLYAITSNMCKDWIRRQSKRPDCAFVEDQEPAVIDRASLDSYSEELALRSIRDVLDSLPKTYHQVLALFYLGGMSVKEIAGFLGTPPRTVERRLREARAQLKEEMLAEMKTTFDEHRLHGGFTFVIVEAVKRMKIQPMPRTAGLPWGLSLATGIILMFVCLGSHLNMLSSSSFLPGSPLPAEARVLETGEIPVDILEVSRISVISSSHSHSDDGGGDTGAKQINIPTMRSTLPTDAESSEHTERDVYHSTEVTGRYLMKYYAEKLDGSQVGGGWSEIRISDSGLTFGNELFMGGGPEPLPWYMMLRYMNHPDRQQRFPTSVGDQWTTHLGLVSKANTVVESNKETVIVPGGIFQDCLKLKTVISGSEGTQKERDFLDGIRYIWFAPAVGLVRLEYHHNGNATTEIELTDYSVSGRDEGYFPLDLGNRWTYEWTNGYRNHRVRETCAVISSDPGAIEACKYVFFSDEESSREMMKKELGLDDEELDAAVRPLLESRLVEWKYGKLWKVVYGLN